MADQVSNLDVVLRAKNEGEGVVQKATSELNELGNAGGKAGMSFGSMTASFVTGQAIIEAASKAFSFLKNTIMEGITAIGEDQAATAQLTNQMQNMGQKFVDLVPQITAYAEKQESLGFQSSETTEAMGHLIQKTGSYSEAVKLNALAMDIARYKHEDLSTASDEVIQLLSGKGVKALADYGIELDKNATRGEILDAIQQKVGNSAATAAETSEGKTRQMSMAWENAEKSLASGLAPEVDKLKDRFIAIANDPSFQNRLRDMGQALGVLANAALDAGSKIAGFLSSIQSKISDAGREFGNFMRSQGIAWGGFTGQVEKAKVAVKEFGPANLADKFKSETSQATAATKGFADTYKQQMAGVGGSGTDTAKKLKEEFRQAMIDMRNSASSNAQSMVDIQKSYTKEAGNLWESLQKKIADINANIAREAADFTKQMADSDKSYADERLSLYMNHQDKVADLAKQQADLQKKLNSGEGTEDDIAKMQEIQKQLTDENKILEANADQKAAAEAFRATNDLERLKTKHQSEQAELQKEHQEKMDDLNKKLLEEQAAYDKQKADLIISTQDKYEKLAIEVQKGWQKMIDDAKFSAAQMQAIESQVLAIKASIQAAKASVGSSSPGTSGAPAARASGGPVSAGVPYIVGEAGAELFVPSTSGTIVPNGKGGGYTFNFSIGNLWGANPESAAREIGDTIIKMLQSNRRIAT